jgi:Carboxypeptidase regulatory-like domain
MLAAAVLTLTLATVQGTISASDSRLPGCVVTVRSAKMTRSAVSDVEGRYRLENIPEGEYEISFELENFETARQRLLVRSETVRVPPEELRYTGDQVTYACGGPCYDTPPEDRYGLPLCSEYLLNESFIELARRGDASAIAMLEKRAAAAETDRERYRLFIALLGRSKRDAELWREVHAVAEVAVRFPDPKAGEYLQWCAERGVDPEEYWQLSSDVLWAAAEEPRARDLLLRSLETKNESLVSNTIELFSKRRDLSALPAIDKALARLGDEASFPATALAYFNDERANAIARKYLDEDHRALYRDMLAALAEEPRN